MKKAFFSAGYYDWRIFIDDKLVACLNISEPYEHFTNIDELEQFASDIIDELDDEARRDYDADDYHYFVDWYGMYEENRETWRKLTSEEKQGIKDAIVKSWTRYLD